MKNFGLIFEHIKKRKGLLIVFLLLALIFVSASLLVPVFVGNCIDQIDLVIRGTFVSINDTNFYKYLIAIICLIIVSLLSGFASDYLAYYFAEITTKEIRNDLYKKINNLPLSYIDKHSKGDLLARLISDVENINTGMISGFKQFVVGVVQILLTLGIMLAINWILGLTVLILTPISFLISSTVVKVSGKYFKKQAAINGEIGALTLESLQNLEIIRSYNLEDEFTSKFNEKDAILYKNGQKAQFSSSFTNPSTRLINNTSVAIVTLISALMCAFTWDKGNAFLGTTCTVGTIVIFIQFANQFAKPLNEISSCISEIQNALASLYRVKNIMILEEDFDSKSEEKIGEISSIEFDKMNFGYEENKPILKDISFKINKGSKVAIVGESGCGKTTLINLLLRFYDPQNGVIKLNENDIKNYSKNELRNHFTMVLQDTWIFGGSILENIAFENKGINKEEVYEAAKKANCFDLINRLPNGFDTIVSGNELSEGEKQLICLARAFLNIKEVVILDEATSSVDAKTELLVTEAFNRLLENRTSFVIAHRLFTIKNSDLIIVIKDGSIVEIGQHEELLKQNGHYLALYNAQYKE